MDSSPTHFLFSLSVFRNTLNQELIRTLHVYKALDTYNNDCTKEIEREFLFSEKGSYVELMAVPYLTLLRFPVSQVVEGQLLMGLWFCMFSFRAYGHPQFTRIPPILSVSRNPKLKAVPTLAKELEMIFQSCPIMEREEALHIGLTGMHIGYEKNKEPQRSPINMCRASRDKCHRSRSRRVLDIDLNLPPDLVATSGRNKSVETRKRAAPQDIARLTLEDLVQYFDLPITEASKQLKVGLTVLKKKCREFGIPRWPHRKIKSLDSLIHDLQEESKRHQEDRAVAVALARRQKMLENEKETIEKKPFVEMQAETKKFRQDVFKRRHKAKALQNSGSLISPN